MFATLGVLCYVDLINTKVMNVVVISSTVLILLSQLVIVMINDIGSHRDKKKRFYLENGERETIPQNLATKIDREIKEKYTKNCLKGDLIPGKVTIFETKVGGFPYLPKDMMFPKDKNGVYMRLLVQIKCDDLGYLDGFPNTGILQIFTSKSFNFVVTLFCNNII